jgi:hypothetical protein
MSKKLLSWVIVLTLIAGFAQNQMPPIEVLAVGIIPSFLPGAVYPTGSAPYSVAAADLNGDSRPDIVVANSQSDTVSVLLNNGTENGTKIDISVLLQGSQRPESGWIVPLTVKFFTPGAVVMTATPVYTFNLTTAKAGGNATAQCTGVMPGNYDITAVSEHTLVNVKRNVTVIAPSTMVNLGTLLEGNANNNNLINIQDFGLLATSYGKIIGNPSFNVMADFDRNDIVNIFDFGLLATNYLKIAPIVADELG